MSDKLAESDKIAFKAAREQDDGPNRGYAKTLLLSHFFLLTLFLAVSWRQWTGIDSNVEAIGRERGRALVNLIQVTREWRSLHGGVFALAALPPSVREEAPVVAGKNAADQGADADFLLARKIEPTERVEEGVRFNITSLNPIGEANAADDWEQESLRLFAEGAAGERIAYADDLAHTAPGRFAQRYMAPLKSSPACLECHQQQGIDDDMQAGISVTMPAGDLLALRDGERSDLLFFMFFSYTIAAGFLQMIAAGVRHRFEDMRARVRDQDQLILVRTREIADRNEELKRELEERRLRVQELRIAGAVFENATEAIMVADANNLLLRVNPAFTKLTGYEPAEVIGRCPGLLKSEYHDEAFYAAMQAEMIKSGRWEGEIRTRHKSGEVRTEWLSLTMVSSDEFSHGHFIGVFYDITQRKEMEAILRHKAGHDALTDLPNRALFNDRLNAAFHHSRRYGRQFALLMVDLDHYKEVNDNFGHAAGDELLIEAARRLVGCVRESDTVARLGGDEFAVILSEIEDDWEAQQIAARIVAEFAEPFFLDAGTAHISSSVGMAIYPEHGGEAAELMQNADAALYAVKQDGRNGYRSYINQMQSNQVQAALL